MNYLKQGGGGSLVDYLTRFAPRPSIDCGSHYSARLLTSNTRTVKKNNLALGLFVSEPILKR